MKILDKFNLNNQVAIVSGASGLLGSIYCATLAQQGAKVIGLDKKISKTNIKKTFNEFELSKEFEENIIFEKCDITKNDNVKEVFKKNSIDKKNLKILINNASLVKQISNIDSNFYKPFLKSEPKDWKKFFEVDLVGTLILSKLAIPIMIKNNGGSIVNISSTYGILSPDQRLYKSIKKENMEKPIGYSISKSGILNLTRHLATLYGEFNVRVNTLTLGGVFQNNPKAFVKKYSEKTPLNRMANKFEYCASMLFLVSNASSYMTGSNLIVDGGWSSW